MKKNKTGKYLKYAIGEIVLVVVGILIALQVNDWNEDRKALQNEKNIYSNIIEDLKRDKTLLQYELSHAKEHQKVHYRIFYEFMGDSVYDENFQYDYMIIPITFHSHLQENHFGVSKSITDKDLTKSINTYFRALRAVEESINEHNSDIKNEIVNFFAEKGVFDVKNAFNQEGGWERNPQKQILLHEKLIQLQNDNYFQGFLVNQRMWTQVIIERIENQLDLNDQLVRMLEEKL